MHLEADAFHINALEFVLENALEDGQREVGKFAQVATQAQAAEMLSLTEDEEWALRYLSA